MMYVLTQEEFDQFRSDAKNVGWEIAEILTADKKEKVRAR